MATFPARLLCASPQKVSLRARLKVINENTSYLLLIGSLLALGSSLKLVCSVLFPLSFFEY